MAEFIECGEARPTLAALALSRRLAVARLLVPCLSAAARSPESQIASAAVAALGDAYRHRSVSRNELSPLLTAIEHADPRVRANAIEAMGKTDQSRLVDIEVFAETEEANRPRADAIRSLLRHRGDSGVRLLRRMLHDERSMHRISAIWVSRRVRAMTLLPVVAQLAHHDQVPLIRERARSAAEWLARSAREDSRGG